MIQKKLRERKIETNQVHFRNDKYSIFKNFVKEQRPQVDTEIVATGETWQGEDAVKVGLVDSLETSDNLSLIHI